MIPITYGVIEETYSTDEDYRVSYGIACYADLEECGTATIVNSVRDISSDKKTISDIVLLFNTNKLSLIHFEDVVDDIFGR